MYTHNMIPKQSVIDLFAQYRAFDETEQRHTHAVQEFLATHDDCFSRNNSAGHITASAFVVTSDLQEVVLVHHKKIDKWFQPGGHTEPEDTSIEMSARREVLEETGLDNLQVVTKGIFDVDVHRIAEYGGVAEHKHYDIRFLYIAQTIDIVASDESNQVAWVSIERMLECNDSSAFKRAQHKLQSINLNK